MDQFLLKYNPRVIGRSDGSEAASVPLNNSRDAPRPDGGLWLALVAIISVMHCQTVGTIVAAIEELKQHT